MIWNKLKTLLTKQVKNSSGSALTQLQPKPINECYSQIDTTQRRQGDVYPANVLDSKDCHNIHIPYWMLLNRTCQLHEKGGRICKLPSLNYAAVYGLRDFIQIGKATVKNQVSDLVNGKQEAFVFLPENKLQNINSALVVNFNLIITISRERCPPATSKCIQLSSPFCEHVFQKFSRFFYTVGYDDESFRTSEYITSLVLSVEKE